VTRRLEDLPSCPVCGGSVLGLSLCDYCGVAVIRRDLRALPPTIDCPECHAANPAMVICDTCHARQALATLPEKSGTPGACPSCATFLAPGARECPACGRRFGPPGPTRKRVKARKRRRIKGAVDESLLREMRRIPGVDEARARALLAHGYTAAWKINRASVKELAAIEEVGIEGAREIREGLRFVRQFPQRRRREVLDEEYTCPLCDCVTSAFSAVCPDCGVAFDEEEMDEDVRRSLLQEGEHSLLAFYDLHLGDDPDDSELWYARGLLMESMGQKDEAFRSLDRAAALSPASRKIGLARARFLAKSGADAKAKDEGQAKLRELVEDVAVDQGLKAFQQSLSDLGPSCSFCDEPLPANAAVCPACSMPVGRPQERAPAKPEEPEEILDTLVKNLEAPPEPAAHEEEREVTTPASLEALVDKFEDSLSPEDVERTRLATLDWLMDELEEAVTVEPEAPTPGPIRAKPPSEAERRPPRPVGRHESTAAGFRSKSLLRRPGYVNGAGAVNGKSRVNGLVNGRVNGLVNGRGRVNGFINGKGYVNGAGIPITRLPAIPRRATYGFIAAGLAMLVVFSALLFFPPVAPAAPVTIDGQFDDWAAVPFLDLATRSANPDVEIVRYAAFLDRTALFLHAATRGPTFGDVTGFDGIYFLIDADGTAATGLLHDGLGIDYVVETYGNVSSVSARLFSFPPAAGLNWSARESGPSLPIAASNRGVEVLVSAYVLDLDPTAARIAVYADDYAGASSRGRAPLSVSGGFVLLETRPLATIAGPGSTDLLEVRARGLGIPVGETWTVSGLSFRATLGLPYALSAESVSITRDRPTDVITVSVQVSGFFSGDVVEVELVGAAGPRPVAVASEPVRAYVLSVPTSTRIDGLFAEWAADAVPDTDLSPVDNPNVDLVRYAAATDLASGFFFTEVAGTALGGSVPQRHRPSPPGSGGGTPAPPGPRARVTGEDILRVYVESNASVPDGFAVGGIRADLLLDVRGHSGRVTSRALYEWSSGWRTVPGATIVLAKNASAIEGSFPMVLGVNGSRVVFESTDWSGITDLTEPVNATIEPPFPAPEFSFPITINAPEFEVALAPVAGTVLLGLACLRRRRHRRPEK